MRVEKRFYMYVLRCILMREPETDVIHNVKFFYGRYEEPDPVDEAEASSGNALLDNVISSLLSPEQLEAIQNATTSKLNPEKPVITIWLQGTIFDSIADLLFGEWFEFPISFPDMAFNSTTHYI